MHSFFHKITKKTVRTSLAPVIYSYILPTCSINNEIITLEFDTIILILILFTVLEKHENVPFSRLQIMLVYR